MSRSPATPYDVNGRTVFITGAARGIGAAIAERLHRKGANVALVGLEPERLQTLAERLGPHRTLGFQAGLQFNGALASTPIEQIERTLAVNFLGVWRTDRAVIEQIVKRRGYLLNI